MTSGPNQPAGPAPSPPGVSKNDRLGLLFIGIVLVELLTIAGLYWMGVHFQ
jgi:hypothetical protein